MVTPYRGVCWHKHHDQYRVQIKYRYKSYDLGYYDDPKIAARVYDCAAKILHGPDAKLNFDGFPPPGIPRAKIYQILARKGAIAPRA